MKVNSATLMFDDLTQEDCIELLFIARKISVQGIIEWDNRFIKEWRVASKFNENQILISISTVFVMRAFDSVLISMGM